MRVYVLTTDGKWWTIAPGLTKDEEAFTQLWAEAHSGDLIETVDAGVFIQKCCISAVKISD